MLIKQTLIIGGSLGATLFMAPAIAESNNLDECPTPDRVFRKYQTPLGWCHVGWQLTYRYVGNRHEKPLELKYVPGEKSAPSELSDWQHTINEEINQRFHVRKPIDAGDKLVVAQCNCLISSDGKIEKIEINSDADSEEFNSMIRAVLQSLSGNSVLKFPQSYKDSHYWLSGRFVQNYGPKYMLKKEEAGS